MSQECAGVHDEAGLVFVTVGFLGLGLRVSVGEGLLLDGHDHVGILTRLQVDLEYDWTHARQEIRQDRVDRVLLKLQIL